MKNLRLSSLRPQLFRPSLMAILAIQICALAPQLQFIAYLLVIIFIARLIPINDSAFTRLGLAFGLATASIGFIALVSWFLGIPLTAWLVLTLLNIGLLAISMSIKQPAYALRTNRYDLTAFLIGMATILVVMWPLLQNAEGQTLAKIISNGGDNMAHLEMMKAGDLNQGVAYGLQNRVNPIANAINYPQNWHFNLAFLKWITEPLVDYVKSPSSVLFLFYSFSALWLGLLMFFIARISLMIIEQLPGKKSAFGLVGTIAVCTGFFLHWLAPLFTFGFQAQIAASVLLLMELLLIMYAFGTKPGNRYLPLLLATVMLISLNSTWTFLSPLAAILLAAALALTIWRVRSLGPRYFVVGMITLGLLGILQPLFYKLFPVEYEFPTLLQRGYVQETYLFTLIIFFLAVGLYLVLRWRNKQLRTVFFLASCALIFLLAMLIYHLSALGELRYFYYKATYTFIIVDSIILAAIAYELASTLIKQRAYMPQKIHTLLIYIVTLSIAGMVCWQVKTPEVDTFMTGKSAGIDNSQADYILDAMSRDPLNGYHSVFIGSCNRGNDIRATQMLHALAFRDSAPYNNRIAFEPGSHDQHEVFDSIVKAARIADRPITVFSNDQVLSAHLTEYAGSTMSKIKIVQMDATPETEPLQQCPDRIRDLTKFPA